MLSVIITAHNEGDYLLNSIRSVTNSKKIHQIQIVIVADNPNPQTKEILASVGHEQYLVNFNDVALSRNFGVSKCSYDHILILDGDDAIDPLFIEKYFNNMRSNNNIIFHPEFIIYFDEKKLIKNIRRQFNVNKNILWQLAFENIWTSCVAAHKEVFLKVPYRNGNTYDEEIIYGFEDWTWNRDTLDNFFTHKILKDSYSFVLVRSDSNSTRSAVNLKIPSPTELFVRESLKYKLLKWNTYSK